MCHNPLGKHFLIFEVNLANRILKVTSNIQEESLGKPFLFFLFTDA